MRSFLLSFFFIISLFPGRAAELDSVRLSLLTCAPGSEIYALFGHSAIRYENPVKQQDWVFNYGMFSFKEPNFVMRFVKGETDYQLGVIPFRYFEAEYAMRGSSVYQQVLNLTNEEKMKLIQLLEQNYLPSNRRYRYNYFYDNCTTRARDKVEESIQGKVIYPENKGIHTYRSILHEFMEGSAWSEFGIDLCLGSGADKPIEERQQMFAPFYMLEAARGAMIHRADTVVPFISEETQIVDATLEDEPAFPLSPMTCALIICLLTATLVGWGIRRGRMLWGWSVLLYAFQGIAGCIVAFLFFFSLHPTVDSNWLLMVFQPLPLMYLPVMIYKCVKKQKDPFHWLNAACLTSFILLMPFLPQEFNATVLPLALSLLMVSIGHLYIDYWKHR
ncbi:MAG: DUF4105 domain-containing protein [Bacteroides sp.]|nr:DUF4105 domain-containing protein [Bacteroides sp.]